LICQEFLIKYAGNRSGFHRRFELENLDRQDGEHIVIDQVKLKAIGNQRNARRIMFSVGAGNVGGVVCNG